MIPPHLPNPVCNIKSHGRWLQLKLIITVAVFGLLAGITGASMALGWIWPGYGGGDTWIVSQNRSGVSRGSLEQAIYDESAAKIYSVYREASRVEGLAYLALKDKIGEAVAVSSDGWMAMYVSQKESTAGFGKWRITGVDGAVYTAGKALFDPYVRIAYFKVVPLVASETKDKSLSTQFKVVSFQDTVSSFEDIYVRENNDWRYSRTSYVEKQVFGSSRLDSAINYAYSVEGSYAPGTVAINSRGRVVGLIMENNLLLPSVAITRILPGVLSGEVIEYPSFGVAGWFTTDQPAVVSGQKVAGFAVDRVWSKKSVLRRGDVVTEINGQLAHEENLWYNIGDSKATLTVWRQGKFFDLPAEKIKAGADSF